MHDSWHRQRLPGVMLHGFRSDFNINGFDMFILRFSLWTSFLSGVLLIVRGILFLVGG